MQGGREADDTEEDEAGLTYAAAGVDIDASDAATAAIVDSLGDLDTDDFAGLLDLGDRYLALATDGVGTKLLVASALERYDTIGIDCIAMNVNDLVAMGIEPLGFVDYLAMDEADDEITTAIGEGLAAGADTADVSLLGGELAILPEVVDGFDLAGACVGMASPAELFDDQPSPGDLLVGFPSSGIHSNGLTLARKAIANDYEYTDPFPADPDRRIGDVLLEPTRIYTHLLDPLRRHGAKAVAHVTGGGWSNVGRLGDFRYVIDDPLSAQPIFRVIADSGGVHDAEMHRTFNMGTGFVAALPADRADALEADTDGRVIGRIEPGTGVRIRGHTIETDGT